VQKISIIRWNRVCVICLVLRMQPIIRYLAFITRLLEWFISEELLVNIA